MKFEVAYYEDTNGKVQQIKAKDLENSSVYELASNLILYDGTGQFRLWPRQHGSETGRPHFQSRDAANCDRKTFKFEDDDEHKKRIEKILKKLEARANWTISIKEYGEITPKIAFDLINYTWRDEVHRIASPEAFVRHDIFGQAKEIGMSIRRPWIAIEVVNTHFPEEEAFAAFLELSARFPFVVIFELIEKDNYFSRINELSGLIEPIFYIYDGSVWKNSKRRDEITTSSAFSRSIKDMIKARP